MIHDYKKPAGVSEAVELMRSLPDGLWYAGGTRINNREYGEQSGTAVSIELLELDRVVCTEKVLTIGAAVTLQELIDHQYIPEVIKAAARFVHSRNVRNIATVGGNIGAATADSALLPLLLAYGAELETPDGVVLLSEYLHSRSRDLILSVHITDWDRAAAVRKISRASSMPPVVSAAVVITQSDAGIINAGVYLGGLDPLPLRLDLVEKHVETGNDAYIKAGVMSQINPPTDSRGSREYKRYIAAEIVYECIDMCRGGLL